MGRADVLAASDSGDPGTFLHPNRGRRWRAIALTIAAELALVLIAWFSPSFREIVKHPASILKTFDFKMPAAGGAP
jgi:hypothetical protein